MNDDELTMTLLRKIEELENRIEYLEAVEKTAHSMINLLVETRTISGGSLDATGLSYIYVDGEGSEAADNLDTITGSTSGQILILTARYATDPITVRDNSVGGGNIYTVGAASRVLNRAVAGQDQMLLIYNSLQTAWYEIAYADI